MREPQEGSRGAICDCGEPAGKRAGSVWRTVWGGCLWGAARMCEVRGAAGRALGNVMEFREKPSSCEIVWGHHTGTLRCEIRVVLVGPGRGGTVWDRGGGPGGPCGSSGGKRLRKRTSNGRILRICMKNSEEPCEEL